MARNYSVWIARLDPESAAWQPCRAYAAPTLSGARARFEQELARWVTGGAVVETVKGCGNCWQATCTIGGIRFWMRVVEPEMARVPLLARLEAM